MTSLLESAYTPAEVNTFLSHISLPAHFHPSQNPPLTLPLLTALHQHTITTAPYENLQMHYARNRAISTDPHAVLAKATRNARGGFCVELNVLFAHLLRAYGIHAFWAGAKIRPRKDGVPGGEFMGWVHAVVVATLPDGTQYVCDCAFGGDGPVRPLPLVEGVVCRNIGAQEVRLRRGSIPGQMVPEPGFWLYEYRNAAHLEWNTSYAFCTGVEFSAADLELMGHVARTLPTSFLLTSVLIVKFLRGEGGDVVGKVLLVNADVKVNEGGRTRVVKHCETERERIEALKEWFGITLTDEEREAITDMRLPD